MSEQLLSTEELHLELKSAVQHSVFACLSSPFCQLRLHEPSKLLVLIKHITFNYMLITQQQ